MKVKITTVQVLEVGAGPLDQDSINEFEAIYRRDLEQALEVTHETADGDFTYDPQEVLELKFEWEAV